MFRWFKPIRVWLSAVGKLHVTKRQVSALQQELDRMRAKREPLMQYYAMQTQRIDHELDRLKKFYRHVDDRMLLAEKKDKSADDGCH